MPFSLPFRWATTSTQSPAARVPDWLCPTCNVFAYGSKPTCIHCGAKNPGFPAGGVAPPPAGRLPDWLCPNCNHTVFGSKPECRQCGAKNPGLPAGSAAAAAGLGMPPTTPSTTTANAAAPPAPQPQPQQLRAVAPTGRLPDWPCPNCNFSVFGSKPACHRCGAKNPGLVANAAAPSQQQQQQQQPAMPGRAPDWPCPNCSILVFGSRPECMRCKAPNPWHKAQAAARAGSDPAEAMKLQQEFARREEELKSREAALAARMREAAAAAHAGGGGAALAMPPPPPAWVSVIAAPAAGDQSLTVFTTHDITNPEARSSFASLVLGTAAHGSSSVARVPRGFEIKSLRRVENAALWVQYATVRRLFAAANGGKPPLPTTVATMEHLKQQGSVRANLAAEAAGLSAAALELAANEVFAFHGTKPAVVDAICRGGFDERVGSLSGLYGSGIYFADDFNKSHGYAGCTKDGVYTMFVARVLLGAMTAPTKSHTPNARRAPEGFDAVCGLSNAKELVVYDRRQTYPEFIMEYTVQK